MQKRLMLYFAAVDEWRTLAPGFHLIEILNTLGAAWWSWLFLLPGSLFATNPAFGGLADHAPEWQWGSAFVLLSLLSLLSLLFPHPLIRLIAFTWGAGVWSATSICFAYSALWVWHTPENSAVGCYGIISFLSLRSMLAISAPALQITDKWWDGSRGQQTWQLFRGKISAAINQGKETYLWIVRPRPH